MGWYDGFDHYVVEKDIDLAAWDDYVGQGHLNPARNGFAHDRQCVTRPVCGCQDS